MPLPKKILPGEEPGFGVSETEASSALVLAFRFFALAIVASSATLLLSRGADLLLVVAGISAAVALALIQFLAVRRGWLGRGSWLIVPHVVIWTLLVHATGGQRSPLIVGYLLELPLSGTQLSRSGVATAALASVTFYLLYAWRFDPPFQIVDAAIVVGFIAVCAAITWGVVGVLERQRSRIANSRSVLTHRAETLSEELRLLGDYLGGALMSIDERGRIASLNPAGAALLGVEPPSVLGKAWQEALRVDSPSASRLLETLDSGTPQRGVPMLLRLASGRTIAVRAEMWPSATAVGRWVNVLLEPTVGPAADDPMRRLGEGAACVAHQIKNSVHALQGFAKTLDRDSPETRIGGISTDQYLAALHSLGALADDVLASAGANGHARERVVIQDVLRSAAILLDPTRIRLGVPEEPLHVRASRCQLIHALFNLMDNAVRANPPGRLVDVRAERSQDLVWVEIVDNGPGIPASIALANGPVPSERGSGLGLMAARRFVEDSGGQLSLISSERGTCCRVELPAALGAVAAG